MELCCLVNSGGIDGVEGVFGSWHVERKDDLKSIDHGSLPNMSQVVIDGVELPGLVVV